MAKIKLTLPGLEIPVNGKQVSFTAPCSCSAVDGIHIDGVDYDIVDSIGRAVPFGRGVWAEGSVLSVILDVTNHKAYLQNQNAYTRAETLTEDTAELFGLGADAVPDDVLVALSRFQSSLGNEYVWSKNTASASYSSTGKLENTSVTNKFFSAYGTDCYIGDTFEQVALGKGTLVTVDTSGSTNVLNGKYFKTKHPNTSIINSEDVYYIPANATWLDGNGRGTYDWIDCSKVTCYTGIVITLTPVGYVNSPNPNAYPIDDGYTYTALGQLGNKVRIATGSYTGTGAYGESNPNSLTFDFAPKVILLLGAFDSMWGSMLGKKDYGSNTIMVLDTMTTEYAQRQGFINSNKADYNNYGRKSSDGKTVEWYSTISASTQCNISGVNYHYIAIG